MKKNPIINYEAQYDGMDAEERELHDEVEAVMEAEIQAKTKPVTLRIRSDIIDQIKIKAKAEGLPYQTWIKSILHKALL